MEIENGKLKVEKFEEKLVGNFWFLDILWNYVCLMEYFVIFLLLLIFVLMV